MGYHRAGFDEIVGVDIAPQPHYPFEFVQADAMTFPLNGFDAIHASPPCQGYSTMKPLPNCRKEHPDLVAVTRMRLVLNGTPFVIENVPGSPLRPTLMLCGSMFGLHSHRGYLRRHRLFECSTLIPQPQCHHEGKAIGVYGHGSAGHLGQRIRTANVDEARILMGTPTMTRDGMSQAVPPAYTEYIGKQLLCQLQQP